MSGHRKWSEVRARRKRTEDSGVSSDARETVKKRIQDHVRTLAELRRARFMTQRQLAQVMHVSQAQVSRVENQADLYLSTLRSYVQAMGGELQIRVAFPGSDWAEVNVGDITASADTSVAESAFEPSSESYVTPVIGFNVSQAVNTDEALRALQTSGICLNVSSRGKTWPTYATMLRILVEGHHSLLASNAASGVVLYEGSANEVPGAPRLAWRTARDPYIPEDSERFISSAEVKEA